MTDAPSKRERLRLWAKSSPLVAPVKKMMPDILKRKLRNLAMRDHTGTINLGNGAMLQYDLDDDYWPSYARNIRAYEPEMWFVIDTFCRSDTVFIDCGANIGLWSCYAGSKIKNRDQVIAVEPNDSILPRLRQNHALNGRNFTLLADAAWNRSDETKIFNVYTGHASGSLIESASNRRLLRKITVRTISIDDIVERVLAKVPRPLNVVVKLDVEGAEKEALTGAARAVHTQNVLLVYEDHGQDAASETTAYILKIGLHVYYADASDSTIRFMSICDAGELRAIKTNRGKGYNFMACRPKSGFDARLLGLSHKIQP